MSARTDAAVEALREAASRAPADPVVQFMVMAEAAASGEPITADDLIRMSAPPPRR